MSAVAPRGAQWAKGAGASVVHAGLWRRGGRYLGGADLVLPPNTAAARELASQLLRHETSTPLGADTTGAADRVCRRVSDELALWMGADGCRALFARALAAAQAAGDHPVLQMVRVSTGSVYCLDGLTDGATRHGTAAANDGAAAVLAALVELVGRLIGDDMALSLLEHGTRGHASIPRVARRDQGTR